jgi:hypothetical protein
VEGPNQGITLIKGHHLQVCHFLDLGRTGKQLLVTEDPPYDVTKIKLTIDGLDRQSSSDQVGLPGS